MGTDGGSLPKDYDVYVQILFLNWDKQNYCLVCVFYYFLFV